MSDYLISEETMTNLANSVRTLSGQTGDMTPNEIINTVNNTKSAIDTLNEHINDKNNPHNVTAEDVGALPLDGSAAMTGNLNMAQVNNGRTTIVKNHSTSADYGTQIRDFDVNNNSIYLSLRAQNQTATLSFNGADAQTILHTGNKNLITPSDIGANLKNIAFLGNNVVKNVTDDTPTKWAQLGAGYSWYDTAGQITDQPSTYGYLINFWAIGSECFQLWKAAPNGALYHRGCNSSGWNGTWKEVVDSSNIGSQSVGWSNGAYNAHVAANNDPGTYSLKNICAGTWDMGAGYSLESGFIYFVYE